MWRRWIPNGVAAALLALGGCEALLPSPVATEAFQKREQALHIALSWNCRPVEAGGLLLEGVVEDTYQAQPILGLPFAATAYDKDGRRLTRVVGFPDGLRIGYEGWTRFRVLVPRGQGAARVDLGYEYSIPAEGPDRPLMPQPPPPFPPRRHRGVLRHDPGRLPSLTPRPSCSRVARHPSAGLSVSDSRCPAGGRGSGWATSSDEPAVPRQSWRY